MLAALFAGILYRTLPLVVLLGGAFGLFALVQLSYMFHALTMPQAPPTLGMPLLYAVAVSIYTVLNFAIWADFSTPATIARNAALGVGVAGWLATFAATALSIWWAAIELPFAAHLRAVAAISFFLFSSCVVLFLFRNRQRFHQTDPQ
ncbi:hypothetical protein [Nesterenkonia sphaerica]|uniref:hypothetical protein n=1 Tax=Nesterenkonia sphaerica TaxID=1804988 RepID=UPI00140CA0FD|nr:hypothetical protein [Nesterenkonia sphaerica]